MLLLSPMKIWVYLPRLEAQGLETVACGKPPPPKVMIEDWAAFSNAYHNFDEALELSDYKVE